MASLRSECSWVLNDAKDGICWIAFWKTGRTWHAEALYGVEYEEGNRILNRKPGWKIDDEDANRLMQIIGEDENAILVNPYYVNIGPWESMTLESLCEGVRWQYEDIGCDIRDILRKAGKECVTF